tara:strand:+ start:283 stop:465 length:183 start_codon:yes stop_codon:yes gene_type:complete
LIDDVIQTGRTARAAMEALNFLGWPKKNKDSKHLLIEVIESYQFILNFVVNKFKQIKIKI